MIQLEQIMLPMVSRNRNATSISHELSVDTVDRGLKELMVGKLLKSPTNICQSLPKNFWHTCVIYHLCVIQLHLLVVMLQNR